MDLLDQRARRRRRGGGRLFLLPRTRHRVQQVGLAGGGLVLLAVASSVLLLALSSVAGLPLRWWAVVLLAVAAVGAVAGLRWWERRATRPLFDPAVLSKPGVVVGLAGALLGYLVLFGPLVLFPEVAPAGRVWLAVGLMVTALPAGFGVTAIGADRLLPVMWSDRRRCVCGASLATVAAGGLMMPVPVWGRVVLLGLLGMGLGVYIPANNAAVMALIPDQVAATVGGMLNMARGLGTALGVAAIAVALHLSQIGGGGESARVAAGMGVLMVAALLLVGVSRSVSSTRHDDRQVRGLVLGGPT